ncbi:homeodomain-like protein [Tanacetum coccineum]
MAEPMEQYMSKTQADYGLGVVRPKIEDTDNFELKGQFLKELRTNTFSGSDHEDANEHIKKVLEIVDLFHIPNITIDQDVNNAKDPIILKIAHSKRKEKLLKKMGTMDQKFAEAYGASHINDTIPQKEKDPGSFTLPCYINNVCFDNALVDLGASVSVMPLLTYLNLGLGELAHTKLIVKLADKTVKYPKGNAENVLVRIGKFTFPVDFIILDMPEDIKVPLILGRSFLSIARAKIDIYKRKITLRVGLRERMELDLEARLMGERLVLNRSLDPFLEDYIELNDLKEPFKLRRNQGDVLMPTIKEGEVIEEFRTRYEDLDTGIDDYPSYCNNDKKIHINCARNLKFSCMIGFEFTHVNFFPLLYVNVMSKKFHNSIMKDKMVYKGDNDIGTLMNVPIFIGTFSVETEFAF